MATVNIPVDFDNLLAIIDRLPAEQKQIIRQHLDEPSAPAESPFKKLARLAAQTPVEFDDAYSDINPDEVVEREFGDYLMKKYRIEHGTQEDTD